MRAREQEEDDGTKVHDIKFDEYGIMDDGVDESTNEQLAKLNSDAGTTNIYICSKWCVLKIVEKLSIRQQT